MPNPSTQELWAMAVKYCPLCRSTDAYWRHGQEFDAGMKSQYTY